MKSFSYKLFCRLLTVVVFIAVLQSGGYSQDHKFNTTTKIKALPVKNQGKSGTCWSFATTSFIESEILRKNNIEVNLSEMFNVRCAYLIKAQLYMRYHGNNTFGPGGQAHDVINIIRNFGMIPDTFFPGLINGDRKFNQNEMDALLESTVKTVLKNGKPSPLLASNINSILENYLGKVPESFIYNGKSYTPESFSKYLGINPDDYVEITSFNHHPFYSKFVLEVPDNWSKDLYYNVPLNEITEIIDHALKNGYTIAWDGDVSERDFSYSSGYAEVPYKKDSVTQKLRQKQFDDWSTTDDHLMHITGSATNDNGDKYYFTKNSWGTNNPYDGYLYLSENYVKLKTIAIMVNKKAIPKEIAKKLDLD